VVRLGLVLPSRPRSWAELVALARHAEAAGVASLWLADPPPGPAGALEPLTALAGLARLTARPRLGALGLDAGRRPPGVLAKALATLDGLSGGRLVVALAPAGPGAEAAGQLAEVVAVLRAAFAGGSVDHRGRWHRLEGLRVAPPPLQRAGPPLWVLGRSDALVALAAAHADGWGPGAWLAGPADLAGDPARLAEACRRAGRDPAGVACSAAWRPPAGADPAAALPAWAAAGVADLVVDHGALACRETNAAARLVQAAAREE